MKTRAILITFIMFAISISPVYAEKIILKSGKSIEGRIIERTDKSVKVDFDGIPLTYYYEDIESIDGKKKLFPKENPVTKITATQNPPNQESVKTSASGQVIARSQTLPFSTVVIAYKYQGAVWGDGMTYIDIPHNKITVIDNKIINFAGQAHSSNETTIYDGKTIYTFDTFKNRGIKQAMEGDIIDVIFNERGYLRYPVSQESFMGKDCRVYKLNNNAGKAYFWNGILLKEEITKHPMGDQFNNLKEAIDIKLDNPIPAAKFQVPGGINFMTPEEAMKKLGEMLQKMQEKGSYPVKQ